MYLLKVMYTENVPLLSLSLFLTTCTWLAPQSIFKPICPSACICTFIYSTFSLFMHTLSTTLLHLKNAPSLPFSRFSQISPLPAIVTTRCSAHLGVRASETAHFRLCQRDTHESKLSHKVYEKYKYSNCRYVPLQLTLVSGLLLICICLEMHADSAMERGGERERHSLFGGLCLDDHLPLREWKTISMNEWMKIEEKKKHLSTCRCQVEGKGERARERDCEHRALPADERKRAKSLAKVINCLL